MKCVLTKQNNRIFAVMGRARLEFSAENGSWLGMCDDKGNHLLDGDNGLSAITLTVGGVSTTSTGRDHMWNIRDAYPVGPGLKLRKYFLNPGAGDTLHLVLEEGDWNVEITYRYDVDRDRIERTADIGWSGDGEQLLRWAELRMPPLAREDETTLDMPGYGNIHHYDLKTMRAGRLDVIGSGSDGDSCCWAPGLLAAEMPDGLLITWLYGGDMSAFWQVYRGHKGIWFEQKWFCCARLQKGDSVRTGVQYIRLGSGGRLRDELDFMKDFWDESGVKLPDNTPTPEWARKAFIYETHVGPKGNARSDTVHNPHPTMRALIDDLPRIAELGFTVLELMPRFPFPNYSVEDYFDIETCYGGAKEDVTALVGQAHGLGMKVFFDVVMHGVTDKSRSKLAKYDRHPLLDKHPEYFLYTDDGRVAKTYTWSFDQANESFQAYAINAFCYYVREFDADGFRVDAITWNFFPNWKKDLPYPAYKSIYGCFDLFPKVREAVWAIKPGVTFYSESTGPLMANSYDLSYNYDEVWLYECLLPPIDKEFMLTRGHKRLSGVGVDARGAAEWLDLRQKVMPKNWLKVHHADSHDSHE